MGDWPDNVELTLDGIAQGGEGVGRWNGRVVFATGGLPGERVLVTLHEQRDSYARGNVTEVLDAAPERVEPLMPGTSHMPWQHIAYEAQLRFKRQILADQISKIGGLEDVPVLEMVAASRPWGYRNSARLHVVGDEIGYFASGTRDIQPISTDPLLQPALNQALTALRASGLAEAKLEEITLRVSEADGYVVAALRGLGDLEGLARRWMSHDSALAGVAFHDRAVGNVELTEDIAGITFLMQPESFFQVNVAAAEALLKLARRGLQLERGQGTLDLFCGIGTFTLPLARSGIHVLGIEEFAGAVRDAEASAAVNNITNVRFVVGPVERELASQHGAFDALLLDPPRRGCHPRALEEMARLAPQRIVYVSCHPGTLARDLKILAGKGYRPLYSTPIDLFPQTPHVESVTVLERVATK